MKFVIIIQWCLVTLVIFSGCRKDEKTKCPETTIEIGGAKSTLLMNSDTVIFPKERGTTVGYFIDVNSDNQYDFKVESYKDFSPCVYISKVNISTLNVNAKVLSSDTTNPSILSTGEKITNTSNWQEGEMLLLEYQSLCELGGGTKTINGNWYDVKNKYIGLKVETKEDLIYGWLKVSLRDTTGIILHEISAKNSCP